MTEQYIRTYSLPVEQAKKPPYTTQPMSEKQRAIHAIVKPYGGKTLVFDTETTTDEKQLLRFGFFTIHGMDHEDTHSRYDFRRLKLEDADMLREAGIFYNPDVMSSE